MRRPYRILLLSAGGLLATCAVLVFVALIAIPRPTHEELARDTTVPIPSSGPGHGWRYASDGTRLYERVYRPAGPRRGVVLYVAGITGLGGDEQPEFVAALVGRGFEVRFLHPRGTGYSDGTRGDIADLDRLLLVDGDADRIVDRAGHTTLYNAYGGADRTRLTVPGGGHGYTTVLKAMPKIAEWVEARRR